MGTAAEGSKSDLCAPLPQTKPAASAAATKASQGDDETGLKGLGQLPLPLVENDKVIACARQDEQQAIVETYMTAAVKFINANRDRPFFLYLPHSAVNFPRYPGKAWVGKSGRGLYGDWLDEVDWSVGQGLDTLRDLKLDRNTLVIFSADNGGTPRAVNAPLRGNKGSTWEGGMRVPTIAGWPDRIPAGTSTDEVTGMLDILPTFAKLGGGQAPTDRKLDGLDSSPVLLDEPGAEGHGDFHFFRGFNLEAVRSGPWKLHCGTPAAGTAGKAKRTAATNPNAPPAGLQFFNLDSDIGESQNVAEAHPDVVQRLQALADVMHADLGTREVGPGVRPLSRVADPLPFLDRDGTVRASAVGSCKNFP